MQQKFGQLGWKIRSSVRENQIPSRSRGSAWKLLCASDTSLAKVVGNRPPKTIRQPLVALRGNRYESAWQANHDLPAAEVLTGRRFAGSGIVALHSTALCWIGPCFHRLVWLQPKSILQAGARNVTRVPNSHQQRVALAAQDALLSNRKTGGKIGQDQHYLAAKTARRNVQLGRPNTVLSTDSHTCQLACRRTTDASCPAPQV